MYQFYPKIIFLSSIFQCFVPKDQKMRKGPKDPRLRGLVLFLNPNLRDFVPNFMVLFVITILGGFVPVSEGFVSVFELF